MGKLINLPGVKKKPEEKPKTPNSLVYVNWDIVRYIKKSKNGNALLYFSEKHWIEVGITFEQAGAYLPKERNNT